MLWVWLTRSLSLSQDSTTSVTLRRECETLSLPNMRFSVDLHQWPPNCVFLAARQISSLFLCSSFWAFWQYIPMAVHLSQPPLFLCAQIPNSPWLKSFTFQPMKRSTVPVLSRVSFAYVGQCEMSRISCYLWSFHCLETIGKHPLWTNTIQSLSFPHVIHGTLEVWSMGPWQQAPHSLPFMLSSLSLPGR